MGPTYVCTATELISNQPLLHRFCARRLLSDRRTVLGGIAVRHTHIPTLYIFCQARGTAHSLAWCSGGPYTHSALYRSFSYISVTRLNSLRCTVCYTVLRMSVASPYWLVATAIAYECIGLKLPLLYLGSAIWAPIVLCKTVVRRTYSYFFRFIVRRGVWLVARPAVPTGPMLTRYLYRRFLLSHRTLYSYLFTSDSRPRCAVCRIIIYPTVLPPCGIRVRVCCACLVSHL